MNVGNKEVSRRVIKRLPRYLRLLEELQQEDASWISSREIATKLHTTSSQVRQDLCCFGDFGHQGQGYNVKNLIAIIRELLGLTREYNMIIVGAGNIGTALSKYSGFAVDGFRIKAMFDVDESKLSDSHELPIYHIDRLEEYLEEHKNTDVAIICTDKNSAQATANRLIRLGIRNIWNFAPVDLTVPKNVTIEDVNISASLLLLTYKMKNNSVDSE